MRRFTSLVLSAACIATVCGVASTSPAADWLQFRGEGGSGLTTETGLASTWSESQNVKWKAEVPGEGWASPIIVNGRVILATAVSEGQKGRGSDTRWELHCLDAATGAVVWTKVASEGKPRVGTHRDNTYASETPVTDGERIITYFGMTGVYCHDLEGNLLWQKDLGAFDMRNDWGTSSSPALHDGMVFLQVDNEQESFIVALDANNGEEKWRQSREESSNWGSAIIWENSLRTELVTSGNTVRSYDPATGEVLWELTTGIGSANSSPAATGDLLLVGGSGRGGGGGLFAIKPGGSGDLTGSEGGALLWSNPQAGPSNSSPLLYDGFVYILDRRGGVVKCVNAETGELAYQERMPGASAFWASPYAYDGKVFCPSDNGATVVLKAGPSYEVVGTNKLEGRFWSTPSIANGALFIRSMTGLYCIDAETSL